MKRISTSACVALIVLGVLAAVNASAASAAPVQAAPRSSACFPGSDPDYPPTGATVRIEGNLTLASARFVPGGQGQIVLTGAVPGDRYCGTAYSTPITLPAKDADSQGRLTYSIAVPASFELLEMHHIDVFKEQVKVGNFDFCVDSRGDLAPDSVCKPKTKSPSGGLARTGNDQLMTLLRAGLVVLALGVGALYVRRRRSQLA